MTHDSPERSTEAGLETVMNVCSYCKQREATLPIVSASPGSRLVICVECHAYQAERIAAHETETPTWHYCGKGSVAHEGEMCGYGAAISDGISYGEETGKWWISNGEYNSPVSFCPWCGLDLNTKLISTPTKGE